MKVLFDMDGVLVDFANGYIKAFGGSWPTGPKPWPWNWPTGIINPAHWRSIPSSFWTNLEPTTFGFDILSIAEYLVGPENIGIVTDHGGVANSIIGKIEWIQNCLMPEYNHRSVFTKAKKLCANNHTVLIDDKDENIDMFRRHGGYGILLPQPWNKNHAIAESEVAKYVHEELKSLKGVLT